MTDWEISKEVNVRKEAFFQSRQIVQVGRAGGLGQLRGNEASWVPVSGSGYSGVDMVSGQLADEGWPLSYRDGKGRAPATGAAERLWFSLAERSHI